MSTTDHELLTNALLTLVAQPVTDPSYPLSTRERQILLLVAADLTNPEIARQLGVARDTVKNHLAMIYKKLGVRGRVGAVVYAYRHDLLGIKEAAR